MPFPDSGTRDVRPYDAVYLTNRCRKCNRLITKLEILHAFEEQIPQLCPCGSRSISPSNPHWYEELFLPRVWKLFYAYKFGSLKDSCEKETA